MEDNYYLIEITDLSVYLVRNPKDGFSEKGQGNIVNNITADCVKLSSISFDEARGYDRENVQLLFEDLYMGDKLVFSDFQRAHIY